MAGDRVVAKAVALRRGREADAGLSLLRADLLPVVAAILFERLGGTPRVRPAAEFLELLADDLDALRDQGFDLPKSAQEYFSDWVKAGYVSRRSGAERDETVELTPQAQAAVRFAVQVEAPRSSVTSSRLANVADLLGRLARDTDVESTSRRAALERERDAIDAAIAELEAGRYQPLPDALALERLAEILSLTSEIPGDFAKVSADIEQLNKGLREQIIEVVGSRGDVLDHVFAGVDVIEESEAGRSFAAFHRLILDPERGADWDDAVSAILERGFASALTREESLLLRRLLTTLQGESSQVRQVMTGFSRSLRRFVESHAYQEHRRLRAALAEAQAAALAASRVVKLTEPTGYGLDGSSIPLSSISSWKLHNPADVRATDPVESRPNGTLDLAALRQQVRLSEIDFAELRQAVVEVLGHQAQATLGEVLATHPATQGLASVVGLLLLAAAVGQRAAGTEEITWLSGSGRRRTVTLDRYLFSTVPKDWR